MPPKRLALLILGALWDTCGLRAVPSKLCMQDLFRDAYERVARAWALVALVCVAQPPRPKLRRRQKLGQRIVLGLEREQVQLELWLRSWWCRRSWRRQSC